MYKKKKTEKKIVMTVYSSKKLSLRERLVLVRRFFPNTFQGIEQFNKGLIMKFNNSVGFSDIEYQYKKSSFPNMERPKIDVDVKNYMSPYRLFICNMMFLNRPDEICSFVVDDKRMYHNNKKFSYDTLEMVLRFQNYLYQVMSDIKIEIKVDNHFFVSQRDWLLSYFLICLSESEIVDNECALSRITREKDKNYIISVFESLGLKELEFIQFYCPTCAEYDPTCPYHTELSFNSWEYRLAEN